MKISHKWLQSYFEETLPVPEKLGEVMTFSFAEVEGIEKVGEGYVYDIKILPDRACYALSHRGVAYDISASLKIEKKDLNWPQPEVQAVRELKVKVEDFNICKRYTARVIEGISQKKNAWVKEHLEVIDQRSINPIVDGSNIVMFDMGQPLHAFDADKVKGGIFVRMAKTNEKITTLDGKEVSLDESILVIADEEGPLAIAGIKGGTKASVTEDTKNIILESANFDASYIRKTSVRIGIRTESSKRFENKISPEMTKIGLDNFTAFIFEMDKNIKAGEIVDIYHGKQEKKTIETSYKYINSKIGCSIEPDLVDNILKSLLMEVKRDGESVYIKPPVFRLDIETKEDIAEEVGRIYGYDKVQSLLPMGENQNLSLDKSFYWEWKVRDFLVDKGFSEVMTSTFFEEGDFEIEKPLAKDKAFLRTNLRNIFKKSLNVNFLNAPVLEKKEIKMFEIGRVFPESGEVTSVALGIAGSKKQVVNGLEEIVKELSDFLGVPIRGETDGGVFEFELTTALESLEDSDVWDIKINKSTESFFEAFSPYPFIVRDVAIFVPSDLDPLNVSNIIKENCGEYLMKGPTLFDTFEKDGKKSLAFRMVFQASDKTLSDEEINPVMDKVNLALKESGWEVR